ncbi:MAG TPA: hypothetical protein VHE61_16190 [Opitutaceae bacterium]|nr:hypothetical protein [Opitutaceae bacterium]
MFASNYAANSGFRETPWPPLRNAVLGYLEQARPHACWGHGEVDITDALGRLKDCQRELRIAVSLHAVILHALARAAVEQPGVMTYRHGRKLVTFEEADVSTTIDRRIGSHRIAAVYCVRGAQRKSLARLNWELREAINQPLPPDPAIHWRRRFAKLPAFLRPLVNRMVTRNPHWVRRLYGTIGLTNLQSHGLNRPFWGFPPTVCTLTLAVGTVVDRLALDQAGRPVARKHLCLVGAADHAVIDGMALSRFVYRFIQLLEPGTVLDSAFVDETRRMMASDPKTAGFAATREVEK